MDKEAKKLAHSFENRLLEIMRGHLQEKDPDEVKDYIVADITNLLVKFFIENKFLAPVPEVNAVVIDSGKKSIRIDFINPKTNKMMTQEDFMVYCNWSPLKERNETDNRRK